MKNLLLEIYKSPVTVFSLNDIVLLLGEGSANTLKSKISYYVSRGKLCAVRKGIYAKYNAHAYLETGEMDSVVDYFCKVAHARAKSIKKLVQSRSVLQQQKF